MRRAGAHAAQDLPASSEVAAAPTNLRREEFMISC